MTEDVKLAFSERERQCLKAAAKLLETTIPELPVSGWSGLPIDPRISARQLLVDVVHDKYEECTGSAPLPRSAPSEPERSR